MIGDGNIQNILDNHIHISAQSTFEPSQKYSLLFMKAPVRRDPKMRIHISRHTLKSAGLAFVTQNTVTSVTLILVTKTEGLAFPRARMPFTKRVVCYQARTFLTAYGGGCFCRKRSLCMSPASITDTAKGYARQSGPPRPEQVATPR